MVRSLRLGDLVIHYAADRRSGRYCHGGAAHDVTRDAIWDGTSAGTYLPKRAFASFKQLVFASPAKASLFSFATA